MAVPEATPWGTGTAGTFYFFDEAIASYGRAYVAGVQHDPAPGATPCLVVPSTGLTVQILTGTFVQRGEVGAFASLETVTLAAADPLYPRVDYVSAWVDNVPVVHFTVTEGRPDNSSPLPTVPIPEDKDAGFPNVVLAMIIVYPGMTAVLEEHIYDRRFLLPFLFTGNANKLATAVLSVGATPAGNLVTWNSDRNVVNSGRALTSVGDVTGPSASVASEVALYDGTTGKLLKRATGSGPARLTSGVLGTGATDLASEVTGDLPFSSLAQGAALSVLGVTGNAAADVASIAAATDGHVLRRVGTAVGFGTVNLSSSNAVTNRLPYGNLPSASAGALLVGRGSSGVGDLEEITLGANLAMTGTVLSASGGASGAPIATAQGTYDTDNTERNLLSFTVPGGTLGTTGGILWYLQGRMVLNSGTNTVTLRVKLGATTLMGDVSGTITNSAVARLLTLWGILWNTGSASAQAATVEGAISGVTAGSVAGSMDIAAAATATFALIVGTGTATEATATDKVFTVSNQFAVSNVAVNLAWKAAAYLI